MSRRYEVRADLDELAVVEFRYPAGAPGPDRHVHREHSDGFYVLEGELTIELADHSFRAGPGFIAAANPGVVRPPGEGASIAMGPSAALFKAEGHATDANFSLTETTIAPGFPGPLPHRHRHTADSFYVLDGTLTVRLGDELSEVGHPPARSADYAGSKSLTRAARRGCCTFRRYTGRNVHHPLCDANGVLRLGTPDARPCHIRASTGRERAIVP